ncbi:MAG: transporter substrate-binding domain-containing protein [Spirochaetales bacterium]|nr:transporter substrate-binding domain-containing protein [Spirochaetales bacterium]
MKVYNIIVLILFLGSVNISALELSLNSADTAPYSTPDNTGFYDILLEEVFDDLGIDIKINHLLSKRSIQNADNGIDDGEYARTEGREAEYKNLRLVPEALVEFYFVAYSKDPDIVISDWESLADYNVAYINGWVYLKNNVPASTEVTLVSNEDSLFKMLLNDRVDLILYSRLRGLSKKKKDGLADIIILDPPLATRGMYLYMHYKYEDIIPDIVSSLKGFKDSGRYAEIMKEYLVFK